MQIQVLIPYNLGHIILVQIVSNKFASIGFKKLPLKENILTYSQEDTYVCERPIELQI